MDEINYSFGINIEDLEGEIISGEWNIEKAKSSKILLLPQTGLINKIKKRSLDKTVYETFATIFFSELLKKYNNALVKQDFTLYSPQTIKLDYKNSETDFRVSSIYQFFCPGIPFNKLENLKEKKYFVEDIEARSGERVAYLSGILSEIFQKEGVIHGDPHLRHFFMLPKKSFLKDINRDNKIYTLEPRNGIGVIDVENSLIEGPYSSEVKKDAEKFIKRVFNRFNTKKAQEYFEKGAKIIKNTNINAVDLALETTKQIFQTRIIQLKDVDMKTRKIIYK